ncbi:MAG: glycosyltransferase family 87 protein [Anaerolineales bacterium]
MARSDKWFLGSLGTVLVATCLAAWALGDLRQNTVGFLGLFFLAFVAYGLACCWALGAGPVQRRVVYGLFAVAVLAQAILVFNRPTLSDDMYRYVWDGRVQAQGISPYRYPPSAPELANLQDGNIYPSINRSTDVTVYPPAAEAAFALLWRIWPDRVHWFQAAMALGGSIAGVLLAGMLHDLKRSPKRLLIYLWSPLLAYETAHSAHVDGLVLPLLVGAWWARVRERDGLVGFLLGIATAMKLYPALLLPFLWRPRHPRGRWAMPLAFGAALGLFYLPYWLTSGRSVLGFLPNYFQEYFNVAPLVALLMDGLNAARLNTSTILVCLTLGLIALAALWAIFHPAADAEMALRRCIWPIGIFTLLSQNLFSWYMLWLLPLVALFIEPSGRKLAGLNLPRLDAWTGWWLFCGLVGLSYTFFINWQPMEAAILAQFLPLYAFLLVDLVRSHAKHLPVA